MIKVSVIVPVYKVSLNYLRECFDSLLAQTMQECEFIIVSDGAPEAECSVCDEYAAKDSRFKFFRREHAGVSATRNFGISQAQGEYITFVDSDDWIETETLAECNIHAKKSHSQIMIFDYGIYNEGNDTSEEIYYHNSSKETFSKSEQQKFIADIIWPHNRKNQTPALAVCKLYARKLLRDNEILFDTNLRIGEDRVFNFTAASKSNSISYLKKIFYHYRQHGNSAMHLYKKKLFADYFAYIRRLEEITTQNYIQVIANETIDCYYNCFDNIYHNNLSKEEIKSEFLDIKKKIKLPEIKRHIKNSNVNDLSLLRNLEIFFMKRGLFPFLILRYLYYCLRKKTA